MQLPEKYKEKFDVSSESPSFGVTSQVISVKAEFLLVFFK
jgi:hypothetical protein